MREEGCTACLVSPQDRQLTPPPERSGVSCLRGFLFARLLCRSHHPLLTFSAVHMRLTRSPHPASSREAIWALLTSSRPGFFFFIRSTGEKMLSLTCDGEWAGSNPEDHLCHPRGLGLRMKPRLKKAEPRNGAITSRCLRTQVQLCLVLLYCSVP